MTLQPDDGKDAWILSSPFGQFTNYSDDPKLISDTSIHPNAGLLEFDLSAYQGDNIQSAMLSLYLKGVSGNDGDKVCQVGVYQVLGTWNESTVTWFDQPDVNTTAADLKSFSQTDVNSLIVFDIIALVQTWVSGQEMNYGIYIGLFDQNSIPMLPSAHIYSSDFKDLNDNFAL